MPSPGHRGRGGACPAGYLRLWDRSWRAGAAAVPGGSLVQEKYFEQREAERTTRRLLADNSIPALYEPAFTIEGIQTRVDILRRTEDGKFDLIEVKSNTSLKDVHVPDVAIQLYVLEGCGVPIRRTFLMRIDRSYVYRGGEHIHEATT